MSQRRIFTGQPRDIVAAVLAAEGFSNELIRERTGMSDGMIAYRLKYVGIKRMDYRNGKSPTAKAVQNLLEEQVDQIVERRVQYVNGKRHGKG